jgi:tetratricopeptide (TPR) repeat protein
MRDAKYRCITMLAVGVVLAGICVPSTSVAHADAAPSPISGIIGAMRDHRFGQALQQSDTALGAAPRDYRLWTLRGMAYSGLGKQALALASFEHALKLSPEYLPALEGAAQVKYQQGSQGARPLLLKVLSLQPADPTSHAMLGALDYKATNCAGAVEHFQQAGPAISSRPDALTEYGSCLAVLKRYDEAIPVLQQVLVIDPQRQNARYNLALAQWNGSHAKDALNTLQPLIEAKPADEDSLTLAADICESTDNTQRAVELLRMAIVAHPKSPAPYIQFADLSYNHASVQVGIDMINAGLTQLPREAQLYMVRGILYTQLGEFSKATDDLSTANILDPHLSFMSVAEGLVQAQQHKSHEALATFRASAKAHPEIALTQYLLAEALSAEGKPQGSPEYQEEIEAASRAVKLDSKMAAAHDLLASLYLQDGRVQLALSHCEAALAVDSSDQQALYHLVLALRKTDRKNEIPELLKRLNEVRNSAQGEGASKKRYQLYEVPASPAAAP